MKPVRRDARLNARLAWKNRWHRERALMRATLDPYARGMRQRWQLGRVDILACWQELHEGDNLSAGKEFIRAALQQNSKS